MGSKRNRIERLEGGPQADKTPWSLERQGGILTAPDGQIMTDGEYLARRQERLPAPFVWSHEAPKPR